MTLVPSYKTQIMLRSDDEAWLYFECHDAADYDQPNRAIAGDTFLAGTIKNIHGFGERIQAVIEPLRRRGQPATIAPRWMTA